MHRDTPTKRSLYGILPRFVKVIACTDDGLGNVGNVSCKRLHAIAQKKLLTVDVDNSHNNDTQDNMDNG